MIALLGKITGIVGMVGCAAWFGSKPEWEPAVGFATALITWIGAEWADRQKKQPPDLAAPPSSVSASAQSKIIDELWERREADVKRLFSEISDKCSDRGHLRDLLTQRFSEFMAGDVYGAKVAHPWDFTLTATSYDCEIVYHPTIPPGNRLDTDEALKIAIRNRNGDAVWPNPKISEQLSVMFQVTGIPNHRFTKLFFRDYQRLGVVVIYEAHVNVIDRVSCLKKSEVRPVSPQDVNPLEGMWVWQGCLAVRFQGPEVKSSDNSTGRWDWVDRSRRVLIVKWSNGYIDTLQASEGFNSMTGKNNLGQRVEAKRK